MTKKRKKQRTARPELLMRTAAISSSRARVRVGATHRRGEEPEIESGPWLELIGTLDQAVRGVHDIRFSLYPLEKMEIGTARPASVGAIIGMRPEMSVVIAWPQRDFDRVWTLAISGAAGF